MRHFAGRIRLLIVGALALSVPATFAAAAPGNRGGNSSGHRQDAAHRQDGKHGNKGGKSAEHRRDGDKGKNGPAHSNRDGSKHPYGADDDADSE